MRFGYWVSTADPFEEVLSGVLEAERLGYEAAYISDHFMPQVDPAIAPHLESWTTLGALAARTSRIRLGVLVSGNTYRHPAILANMAATVDRISNGRSVLGLGAGWQRNEHEAYGIELPEVPELLGRLEEACQVIKSLFEETWSDFDGRWYHLEKAPLEPKPVQDPLPLLLGVAGERISMRIAARYADIWNCWSTPATIAHKLEVLDRHCAELERDPASLDRSTQSLLYLSEDREVLARLEAEATRRPAIVGSAAEVTEALATYAFHGIDEFVLPAFTLGDSHAERMEKAAHFIEEVAAPLRD